MSDAVDRAAIREWAAASWADVDNKRIAGEVLALLNLVSRIEAVVRNPNANASHSDVCIKLRFDLHEDGCTCLEDRRDPHDVLDELRSLLPREPHV